MRNHKEHISATWMRAEIMADIFNHHKVSRKKFHEYFAQQIIVYFADVLIGKQKIGNCPIMTKFIDYMIERKISAKEIFLICMEFRRSMLAELTAAKLVTSENMDIIDTLSNVFNQNLAGVLEYYQNKCLNISDAINAAPDLAEHELEFQAFLEQQENPAITFSKKNLIHANKAFLNIIDVDDIEEFNKKYKTPWEIFDSFEFTEQKFAEKDYDKWLEEALKNKHSLNKVFIHRKTDDASISYRVLVNEIPCKVCEESKKYIMTFYSDTHNEEIKAENFIDALTNIPNKRKFWSVLETEIATYESTKEAVSIIAIKIQDLEHINQIYGMEMGDVVLQEFADRVMNAYKEFELFARIDGDTFSLICKHCAKSSVNVTANALLTLGRSIVFDETINLHPKFSIAIVSLIDQDTKASVEKRMLELIKDIDENGSDHIQDDVEILEKDIQRVTLEKKFLQDCALMKESKTTLESVNFYKELPIESNAKVLQVNEASLSLALRSVAVHALKLEDELFIKQQRPEKDIRATVIAINKIKNTIEVGNFHFVNASPLNRRSVHVQVDKHISVILKHDKKQQVAYLKSISIDTVKLVLPTVCSFSLNHDITLDLTLEWNKNKKNLVMPVEIIKVGKESKGVFSVIFRLIDSAKYEDTIQSYVSYRQREIVQELRALDV